MTVYEASGHDELYRDAGVCIDLDRDRECQEVTELFHDGDPIPPDMGHVRLRLDYS